MVHLTKIADEARAKCKNVLTDALYNNLGFKVKDKLIVLAEAQSTWSVNILFRGLMYLVQTLKDEVLNKNRAYTVVRRSNYRIQSFT